MPPSDSPDTYPAFRSQRELIALGFVLLVVVGLPLVVIGMRRAQATGPARVIELTARLPTSEQGGWSPERITVQKGERIKLRISSEDVVHGFSVPKLDINVDWIEPGKFTEVEFVADQPGRYAFQCTVWCEIGHWRMRGTIEVVDPNDPAASAKDADPPLTDWVSSGIDIDAEHPGAFVPADRPNAARGAETWLALSNRPLTELAASLSLRELSPGDLYVYLSSGASAETTAEHSAHDIGAGSAAVGVSSLPKLSEATGLAELTAGQRWDVVAALYAASLPADSLTTGAALYERDCTGCHGLAGQGDGPGAAVIGQQNARPVSTDHGMAMDKPPVDFTDLTAQTGAPDLLYYGKLVRGGMGTSMPYWGTIYSEDELWKVIAFLRSFAFDLSQ
ncbi:MAG: c-type cytochrome [Anaerolineae bacterium]|nr:c-type cytochrome [Anaerolineae bacterium]